MQLPLFHTDLNNQLYLIWLANQAPFITRTESVTT